MIFRSQWGIAAAASDCVAIQKSVWARTPDAERQVVDSNEPVVSGLRRVDEWLLLGRPPRGTLQREERDAWQNLATRQADAATHWTTRHLRRRDADRSAGRHQQGQQQLPRLLQARLPLPARQQPVVPNLHEPFRQHVLHEPP